MIKRFASGLAIAAVATALPMTSAQASEGKVCYEKPTELSISDIIANCPSWTVESALNAYGIAAQQVNDAIDVVREAGDDTLDCAQFLIDGLLVTPIGAIGDCVVTYSS